MSEFLNDIFKISAMCSGVILVLLLVRKILGKKTGAWWRSIVWLLLLVRLCVPISINSSLSIYKPERVDAVTNYISPIVHQESDYKNINDTSNIQDSMSLDENMTLVENAMLGDTHNSTNIINLDPIGDDIQNNSQLDDVKRPINWLQLVHYVYVCGLVASLVYLIARMLTLAISLKRYDRCIDEKVLQLFYNVKSKMGIRRKVDILIDNNKSVPALCGVFCPKLILPHSAIKCMTEKQLEYVFIHELTHLKRNDVLRLWFVELVLCIHWFNPILYFARPIIRQDMELSCDEKIIMRLQDDSFIDYCNVLMMSSIKKYRPIPGVITANLAGKSGKKLKERLTMIRNFNKKKIIISGVALLMTLILVLVACTTKGVEVDKTESNASKKGLHLGVTVDEMQSKINILAYEYNKLKQQHDENPSRSDNGMYSFNNYSIIEVDDNPTVSKDENGLTIYEYKIRNNKEINILNDEYEIKEYKYSDEMVENKALSLIYIMSEDEKYIKEITVKYNNSLKNFENSRGYQMFERILNQAFINVKENDDTFIDCTWANSISQHSLYTMGRAFNNTVMYCYDFDSDIHAKSITPVYDPDTPIYKMRDDSLAITPDEINEYITNEVIGFIDYCEREVDNNVNPERAKKDKELFSSIDARFKAKRSKDNLGNTVLSYKLIQDESGKDVITLMYVLDSADEYIVSMQLDFIRSNNAEYEEMYEFLDKLLGVSVVELKKNFKSPSTEMLHSTSPMAFDNTVTYENKHDDDTYSAIIKNVPKPKEDDKHLGITLEQMNQKIEALTKKYSELADEYDKNPSKDYESGKWEDNRYVHIELDSQPTKSNDSEGLTEYEYKIRHMKVENEDYLIEEYKVSQEIVENNTTSLVYVMAKDNKHIKEISFDYQVDTYEENKAGDMFNTIVKQAFVLAMDKDDSLINKISRGYTHPLYQNGRAYDNTVMYCYNNDVNKRGGDIVPVYNPEIPIYKSREDSLAITPDELNVYIVEEVEGRLKGFKEASSSKDNNVDYSEAIEEFSNMDTSLIPIKGQDEDLYPTLLYSISKNNKGKDVISIKYTLDKLQKYISRIDLIYNSNNDLTNKETSDKNNIYNVDYLEDVLFDGMVSYRMNFNSPMRDKLGKYEGLAFDGTVMKEKVNEGGISTYTIKHIPKPQNNNNTVSHLGITPKDINNNITYLLKNEWLETGLKIDFNNLTKLNEDGKTIIKYSIVKDKYGEEVLSLSYTLASDDKHIESIMTSINQIYAKGKNYSHCIDLNLIVNKAYLLAISGKQDLEGKIALEDKPLYISEINRDVVSKSIIDTGNNTVTTLVKTSLEIDDALKPTEDKVKKYALTLRVTPDKLSMQIQSLMETSTISSELEFNTKATIIEHEYMQKSIEYNLLRKQDSSKILNMYYIINDNNGLVEGINIIYKRYLGDEKTDVLFKDFCKIADNAYLIASGKEVPESTSEPNYEQVALSEWNNNGRIKVFEAAEHEVYTALIGRTNQWPISYLLDTDERYPHLGITVQQFKHNLELLYKTTEFANIINDIKPKKSTNNNGIVPLEQYAYPIDSNKKGKWVITFSYVLSEDGKHIKSIHRSFDKRIIDGSNSKELQDRYDKLGEMIDIAFVMAKDNIHSYENFSSENFPLPPASHSRLDGTCTLSKAYNDTIYITKEINPLYWEATLISPASPATELIYTYDAFK